MPVAGALSLPTLPLEPNLFVYTGCLCVQTIRSPLGTWQSGFHSNHLPEPALTPTRSYREGCLCLSYLTFIKATLSTVYPPLANSHTPGLRLAGVFSLITLSSTSFPIGPAASSLCTQQGFNCPGNQSKMTSKYGATKLLKKMPPFYKSVWPPIS